MRHPERVVAALSARHPDWAVIFGRYSRELVAFPVWIGYAHVGVVCARSPDRLEAAMACVEAASGRRAHPGPAGDGRFTFSGDPRPHDATGPWP